MRILTRYVLVELLQVFLLTLAGLTALIFVVLIGKEAVKKGLGLGPLLRMTPYLLPQALQFAVPGTMLLATTSVYGRLSAFNEVVATKSLGISPWVLARPALVLAAITSLGAAALNDIATSWGRLGVQRVFVESLEEVIYGQLRLHGAYAHEGVQITVRRVVGRRLVRPTLTVQGRDGAEPITVSAEAAELRTSPERHTLTVLFQNIDVDGPIRYSDPTVVEHQIDLDELFGDESRRPANYALSEIGAEKLRTRARLDRHRQDAPANSMMAMMTGDFERISTEEWAPLEASIRGEERRLLRLGVEPHRRWSTGFSCLCFVMVGAPMAILRQRGEFLASFFLCFLPILLAYYPLLILSVDAAKEGDVPPIAVWVGNIVLALWGLWMMRRVVRH